MSDIKAFPKIAALGTRHVQSIFDEEVEVTEKIDGSQFVFGWDLEGNLLTRSKGRKIYLESTDENDMFRLALEYVSKLEPYPGVFYYCEYLKGPSHNTLKYDRVPKNNLMLFGVYASEKDEFYDSQDVLELAAGHHDIEPVPVIYRGISSPKHIQTLVDRTSVLGGAKAEGVVVKNYKSYLLGGVAFPVMAAKFVTSQFKEKHIKEWTSVRDRWADFKEGHRTEARWLKAVQRLRDNGELQESPRDIGVLIKSAQDDLREEEMENIKDFLWNEFGQELVRKSTAGLPEWYKEQLALGTFNRDGEAA